MVQQALSKGVEMHVAGEFDLASQLYGSVIKLDPNHADANHNMGLLKVDTGEALEALPYLQTALQADTSVAQFWLSYIKALIQLDRMDEASKVLSLAKERGAEGEEFLELHQQLNEPTVEVEPVQSEADTSSQSKQNILDTLNLNKALRLAKTKVKEGSPEEAKRIYQDILEKFPKNKKAQQGLVALNTPKQPATTHGPPQETINQLIQLYNQGQLPAVVEQAQALIQQYPEASVVWNILGAANKGLGRLDQALSAFTRFTVLDPYNAEGYNNLGATLHDRGKLKEALEAYNKALSFKSNNADVFYNMGVTFQEQGKLEQAIEAYNKAISFKSNYAEAYGNMGITLHEQGKLDEAIAAFNKALSLKPDYADAKNNLIEILKIYSPEISPPQHLIHFDNEIKIKHNENALPATDQELANYTLDLLGRLQSIDADLGTELLQIYRQNTVDLNCRRHMKIFKEKEIIPKFCFGCYKVQVEVATVLELIRLSAIFYEIEFEIDMTRKCLVEVRPNISGSYKGLIYCSGIDQANSVREQLDAHLRDINKNLLVTIKRGCSEFPLAFPKYGEIATSEEKAMQYPQEWHALETRFDTENLILPKAYVNPSLKEFCLSDYLIIQKWIDYAKGIGDPTSELFSGIPIKYEEIWKIAKARVKE